jgi:pilus assembly protein CpaB
MSIRAVLLFLLLISGAAAVAAAYFSLQPAKVQPVVEQIPTTIVTTGEILTGALIKPQDLKFGRVVTLLPPDSLFQRQIAPSPDQQADFDKKAMDEVVGAVARHHFAPGDPIDQGGVVRPGDSGFLAAVLQPGMRAITIGVTAISGTGGLIYPGDHVDVILTQTFANSDQTTMSRRASAEVVGQNLRVLAIDQQLQARASGGPEGKLAQTVTLEADPIQAADIEVSSKLGDLSLTIRSLQSEPPTANGLADQKPVWASDVSKALQTIDAERPHVDKPGEQTGVIVMHGGQSETTTVH